MICSIFLKEFNIAVLILYDLKHAIRVVAVSGSRNLLRGGGGT